MRHLLSLAVASALALAVACGDSPPKEPTTPAAVPTSNDNPIASATPAASEPPSTPPPPTTTAAPVASASTPDPAPTPPKKEPVIIGETKDECTPVGIDFEKRARPKLKDCYAEGKKKDANLQGTVKIKVVVDLKGKIKSTKVIEKTLPDPVADCMLKVVKATAFPEVEKCWDSTITIPVTFPTPH